MSICEKSLSTSVFTESLGKVCHRYVFRGQSGSHVFALHQVNGGCSQNGKQCWLAYGHAKIRQREFDSTWIWNGFIGWGSESESLFRGPQALVCPGLQSTGGTRPARKNNAPQGCQYMIVWYVLEVFVLWCKMGVKEKMLLFLPFGLRHCFFLYPPCDPLIQSLIHCSRLAKSAKFVLFSFFDITQFFTYTYTYVYTTYTYNAYIIEGSLEV